MSALVNSHDNCYVVLLSMAEEFRTQSPPNIKCCIQCLLAVLHLSNQTQPHIEAKTHLHLGQLYLQHTTNYNHAQSHLEKAVRCLLIKFNSHFMLILLFFSGIYLKLLSMTTLNSNLAIC